MGAIRSTAQLLSYELVFSSIILILIMFSGSFSLTFIVECQQAVWNIFPLLPIALMFLIAILAETNRPPFDLPEAESELVAGLCEMWFTLSRWSWKTLSWAIGLILYKSNDLTSVVGTISNLYRKRIKYVNKLMNPFKGSLRHKIVVILIIILQLFDNYYIWTSKIMDPTERLAPYINKKLSKRNKLFLIESGNSLFKYSLINYTYELGETIARSNNRNVIALEKGRKNNIILTIKKNHLGEILLKLLPLYKKNFFLRERTAINFVNEKGILLNYYKIMPIFKPKWNNFVKCTPTTRTYSSLSFTHLNNNYLTGKYLTELDNIYPNKDGKYRNLSKFLNDPIFLIKIYNNLKELKLINQNIEKKWFIDTAAELKNGSYTPVEIKLNMKNKQLGIEQVINDDKNRIISEGIRVLLQSSFDKENSKFMSFSHGKKENKSIHTALQVIKNEWNDINWFITFQYNNVFETIHKKIIISVLKKNIQDQRLFDILNKLFNSGVCTIISNKSLNRYDIPNYDLLSYFLINIFFFELDKKVLNIKNDLYNNIINKKKNPEEITIKFIKNNSNHHVNIRFVRYLNTFVLGIKGPKLMAIEIKNKIELFLKSSLHLNLLNDKSNLINIRSDNLFIYNVNITSKRVKILSSNIIQQQKKGLKIRKSKANNLSLLHDPVTVNRGQKIKDNNKFKEDTCFETEDRNLLAVVGKNFNKRKEISNQNIVIGKNTKYLSIRYTNVNEGNKNIKKRLAVSHPNNQDKKYLIVLNANIVKIKKILINTGVLNKKAKPVAMRKLLSLDSFFIISTYINIARLIWTSFSCCDNIANIKKIIDYHIRWSLLHTLAAKHKSTIRKVIKDIYPHLKIKNKDKMIQYYTKDQIKQMKKEFLINDFFPYFKDIDWDNKDLNLYYKIKKDNIICSPCRKFINKNKMFTNKRFFSSYPQKNKSYSINNNTNEDLIIKNIYNSDYLINIYPVFVKSISDNEGQFWNPTKYKELNEDDFLNWFAGFVDAEGLFYIKLRKRYNSCSFVFELHIHLDDLPTLTYIHRRLKIGNIRKSNNSVFFNVNKLEEIKILISIFDKYPLWTHKQLDFKDFKLAFQSKDNYFKIVNIKNNMNKKRNNFFNYILPDYKDLSPYWLVGFVEGDGCFCISKMKAHFYLIQKDSQILNVICKFLVYICDKEKLINDINDFNNLVSTVFKVPNVRLKKNVNPVHTFSITDQDIIYQYIGPFFAKRQMLSRKGFDFYIWLICIHLIIHGYSKTRDGKLLIIHLSKNMNNTRYSNVLLTNGNTPFSFLSLYKSLITVFSEKAPFNLYSNTKHKDLAEKYKSEGSRKVLYLKLGYSVFVYKDNNLIKGSPFSSYKEVNKLLNIPLFKIANYIDTNIEVNGYFLFSIKK